MSRFPRVVALAVAVGIALIAWGSRLPISAKAADQAAVAGPVSSREEGKMEGVVVSARRDGANFTVSVVSDEKGRYTFPRTHLEPGSYTVTIRAVGYEL